MQLVRFTVQKWNYYFAEHVLQRMYNWKKTFLKKKILLGPTLLDLCLPSLLVL